MDKKDLEGRSYCLKLQRKKMYSSVPCMHPPPAVLKLEHGKGLTFPGRIQEANAPTPTEEKKKDKG